MKLTMLGTGNALVTKCYNTCFSLTEDGQCFLVDGGGGNGILHQLEEAQIEIQSIRDIFVTHKHIDHILGIVWLARIICQSMASGEYEGEARIYGHKEVLQLVRTLADMMLQKKQTVLFDDRLKLIEVEDGEKKEIIGHEVQFFDIGSTKAKQFGFTMQLDNGEKLTCCGDEPYNPCEEIYAKGSKWLLHESYCLYSQAEEFRPYERHHSTVKDASQLASELGAENLIIYHTEDKNIKNRKELYLEEGKPYFKGNIFIPNDLESIEL